MNERIEAYLTTHPSYRTHIEHLYSLADKLNKCHNPTLVVISMSAGRTVSVINKSENPKVDIAFFTYSNIDYPTILIREKKTYSFELSNLKDVSVKQLDDSTGIRYTLHLAQGDMEYVMQFDIPDME